MFDRTGTPATRQERRDGQARNVALGRWEDEGGASADGIAADPDAGRSLVVDAIVPGVGQAGALDARQDEIMADESRDGRPPPRWLRLREWRWFGAGALLISVALATWVALAGISALLLVGGLVYGLVLLLIASPALAIGLLRGREERSARRDAVEERKPMRFR